MILAMKLYSKLLYGPYFLLVEKFDIKKVIENVLEGNTDLYRHSHNMRNGVESVDKFFFLNT